MAGRLAEARGCYESVLEMEPRNARALALNGALALQTGDAERAVRSLAPAVEINPDDAGSWNNLGAALAGLGRGDRARRAYSRALELDPRQFDAWHNLATLLRAAGNSTAAVRAFDRALALRPGDHDGRRSLAAALSATGDPWRAARELSRVAEAVPGDTAVWAELGGARQATGDAVGAERAWREALSLEPGNEPAVLGLAESLKAQERHEVAIDALERAADAPRLRLAMGNALLAADDPENAAACFERVLRMDPGESSARLNLGIARLKTRRIDEAEAIFKVLRDAHPSPAKVRYYQGLAALNGGGAKRALSCFEEALARDPLHINSLWYRAHCLRELGRDGEARATLDPGGVVYADRPLSPKPEDQRAEFLDALAEFLIGYPLRTWEPAGKTTRGGFQTASLPMHEFRELREFKTLLADQVERFRRALPEGHVLRRHWPRGWSVDAWGTILHRGGHQRPHIHPGGFVSGVFYVTLPPVDAGDREAGWIEFGGLPYETPADYEPWKFRREPEPGLLVLFPSYMPHSTVPFDSDHRRVSLAFDLIPNR